MADRYGLVMLLIVTTYVLASALPAGAWEATLIAAVQGVTIVAALAASDTRRQRRRLAATLAALIVAVAAASSAAGGTGVGIALLLASLLLVASFVAIIGRIARHQSVSAQTVLGAICCYLLVGLIYAFVFAGVARVQSGPFFLSGGRNSLSDFMFFSYTTVTTTGYGNLIPATGLGRTLAVLEALMGQLFLVTVVARLVALWAPTRQAADR